MLHAAFTCVWAYIYLYTRRDYTYIFRYMRTEFICVGICLRICTQGLYVYVYILRVYTQSLYVRVNMIANIHIKFTYVCVYFGVYSHRVYMCVCICFRICTQRCKQNWHVYVCPVTYIHGESTRGCVKISYTQGSHVCVYLFAFMGTEFKHTCGCVCIYV